jgi:hypothetical protein
MACNGTASVTESLGDLEATVTEVLNLSSTWTTNTAFGGQLDADLTCTGDCWVVESLLDVTFPCTTSATMEASKP